MIRALAELFSARFQVRRERLLLRESLSKRFTRDASKQTSFPWYSGNSYANRIHSIWHADLRRKCSSGLGSGLLHPGSWGSARAREYAVVSHAACYSKLDHGDR